MYLVYLFQEKSTGNVIYVGSTSRMQARLKEHKRALTTGKGASRIHRYMNSKNLKLVNDVRIIWEYSTDNMEDMLKHEESEYYKWLPAGNLMNERPGEDRNGSNNPKARAVRCLNDGRVFKTISSAARYYGITRHGIDDVINGRRKQTGRRKTGIEYKFERV